MTDHHIFHSVHFFDPNAVPLKLSAQVADGFQMLQESRDAYARLDAWTACKAQWRHDRANGKASSARRPQQIDRPQVIARADAQAR
ncbi:MAG: hypothetical protein ABJA49_02940 [Betaproteobacteria bacterium]